MKLCQYFCYYVCDNCFYSNIYTIEIVKTNKYDEIVCLYFNWYLYSFQLINQSECISLEKNPDIPPPHPIQQDLKFTFNHTAVWKDTWCVEKMNLYPYVFLRNLKT